MPVEASISPQGDSANAYHAPQTTPWKAAVLLDLRAGYGVEDIAIRKQCPPESVRAFAATLRRFGLLPQVYSQARDEWRSIGRVARKLVENAEGKQ